MDQENKVSKIIIILPSGTGKERKHSNLAGPTLIIEFLASRLCSKKNWREASALNLWNPVCPANDFYEKAKIF